MEHVHVPTVNRCGEETPACSFAAWRSAALRQPTAHCAPGRLLTDGQGQELAAQGHLLQRHAHGGGE